MTRIFASLLAALSVFAACKSEEKFPAIEQAVASPVDVAVSDDGQRFYVLNADFDRTYNEGSVLVLDRDGNKVGAVPMPRMGRGMALSGNDLLVMIDHRDDGEGPLLQLYDLGQDPNQPTLKTEWELNCSPFNVVMSKGYQHFAMVCIDGQLYVGTLAADRAASTLDFVRSYGISRRALYIDPTRELLIGFTADPKQKALSDAEFQDVTRFDANALEVKNPDGSLKPNEVPDAMEEKIKAQSNRGQRQIYQFFVYDLKAERAAAPGCIVTEVEDCTLPLRPNTDPEVLKELRWIYFKLYNFDGTPDGSDFANDPNYKYYRTNFWEAKPDPSDPNVFYLSHRSPPDKGPHANQIVRVTILDDLRWQTGQTEARPTSELLSFERVYGFKGAEVTKYHYPGDFEVAEVSGQKLMLVNHFRDLVNWVHADTYFSLGAKVLDENTWFSEIQGSLSAGEVTTYYQVALGSEGRAVSCSFYGNAVMVVQVTPGVGFETIRRVE